MATFTRPDGTEIEPSVMLPKPKEIGLIGYIENFEINMDESSMDYVLAFRMRVNKSNLELAAGFHPHVKTGGKVQIRAVA